MDTTLARRMVERADLDQLPADHALRVKAQTFEDAAKGYFGSRKTVTVKQFLGAWARARKAWCAYTKERLV